MRYMFYSLWACLLFVFTACEKEIEMDYRSVEPLYVVEGRVTNEVMEVLVTVTRDMDDGSSPAAQDDAVVTVTAGNGDHFLLSFEPDGYYRVAGVTGTVGENYLLTVAVDGKEFASESVMHEATGIDELYFQWPKVMGERLVILTFSFEDIPGEENYYCYRIYRNGENYRWNVFHDRGNDGQVITLDIVCMTEQMAEDNKEDDWDDILYEGDVVEIELQTIDKRTYDYLFSVGLSDAASTNPVDNFTGGCLGYFAAYATSRAGAVFSYAGILNP
ncbi:MAG: DUF4249 domain-containing protein [Tannerellaceae bacterium]|nr:DUF4249 domain-containing protein [Tannerellaceae bacterium]